MPTKKKVSKKRTAGAANAGRKRSPIARQLKDERPRALAAPEQNPRREEILFDPRTYAESQSIAL